MSASVAPIGDMQALEDLVQENTVMIVSESPTNPYLRVVDVEALANFAQSKGIMTVIDSTFATPFNLTP